MDWGSFFAENGDAFFWLFIAIAAVVVESMTCDLVALWFVPGALAAMILSMFVNLLWLQIAVFLVLSVLILILTKTVFKKHLPQIKADKLNADSLIGKQGIVTEEINNLRETGSVKIKGLIWTARTADNAETIPLDTVVTVCKIEGVKLICSTEKPANAKGK